VHLSLKLPRSGSETGCPSRDSETNPLRRGVREARYHPGNTPPPPPLTDVSHERPAKKPQTVSSLHSAPAPGKDEAGEHAVLRPISCHLRVFSAMYCTPVHRTVVVSACVSVLSCCFVSPHPSSSSSFPSTSSISAQLGEAGSVCREKVPSAFLT